MTVTIGDIKTSTTETGDGYALSSYDTGFGYDYDDSDLLSIVYDVTLGDSSESGNTETDVEGFEIGSVITDLYNLSYSGSTLTTVDSVSGVSDNVITFQGDLNYDGIVSMQDLAYLNAGGYSFDANTYDAADSTTFAASDVDANHDNEIDMDDLAIIDNDWEKSLHDTFTSAEIGSIHTANVTVTDAVYGSITFDGLEASIHSMDATLGTDLVATGFTNSEYVTAETMTASVLNSGLLDAGEIDLSGS